MNRYYLVEPERVVADDLAEAIRAFDPAAVVEVFSGVAELVTALTLARPNAVILSLDPQGFADTASGRALTDEGIPHAFLCAGGSDLPEGAAILASPFSEATVGALLARLAAAEGGRDG